MLTREQAINRCIEVHGNKYDYSKVEFKKVTDKATIICPIHGEFTQSIREHYRGRGCPKCGVESRTEKKRDTRESFIKKAIEANGNKYDYSKVVYVNSITKVELVCPIHGSFFTRPDGHIFRGDGCPRCAQILIGQETRLTQDEFIDRCKKVHGDKYDYSKVNYQTVNDKVCIICPIHGEFWQVAQTHMTGHGCPECGKLESAEKRTKTTEEFIKQAKEVHGDRYDYSKVRYVKGNRPITIICPIHGEFSQIPTDHLCGCGCQKCGTVESHLEREMADYIAGLIGEENIIRHSRDVLSNGYELDVYVPSRKIAFELDGLYWHSEIKKPDFKYHLKKTLECEAEGIRLIHIFEDEWLYKKEICQSRIRSLLGLSERIYARKCDIRKLEREEYLKFFNDNHIQGSIGCVSAYGLFSDGVLVSAMSFGKLRKNLGRKSSEGSYEMLRFCNRNGFSVIGGASKLLKKFIVETKPDNIISYADRRWSDGNLYEKLGFDFIRDTRPSYFYVIGDQRKSRFGFRKDVLISKYGCKESDSEHNFCFRQGWYRIYDCGTRLYEIKNPA